MRRIGIIGWLIVALGTSGCAVNFATQDGVSGSQTGARPHGHTAVIRGQLDLSAASRSEASGKNLRDAVVYVSSGAAQAEATTPPARILTRGDEFIPRVLAVRVGTTVEISNPDGVYHNAFSISQSKRFDVGKLAPGASRSVTFDKPGIVNLYCDLHPNATGFVIVLPTAVFAHADASGAFALPPLPQGTYTITAWHPRFGERHARVNLDGANDVSLSLRF